LKNEIVERERNKKTEISTRATERRGKERKGKRRTRRDSPCEEKERSSPSPTKTLSSKLGLSLIPFVGILNDLRVSTDDLSAAAFFSLPSTSLAFLGDDDSSSSSSALGTAFLLILRGETC